MKLSMMEVFLGIIILIVVTMAVMALLSMWAPKTAQEETCDYYGGQLFFYECQNIPFGTPCESLKTGFYCQLNDGSEISIK